MDIYFITSLPPPSPSLPLPPPSPSQQTASAAKATETAAASTTDTQSATVNSKEGESLSVQQILMPPDTDFLSSFYEAAQARELYTSSQCIIMT